MRFHWQFQWALQDVCCMCMLSKDFCEISFRFQVGLVRCVPHVSNFPRFLWDVIWISGLLCKVRFHQWALQDVCCMCIIPKDFGFICFPIGLAMYVSYNDWFSYKLFLAFINISNQPYKVCLHVPNFIIFLLDFINLVKCGLQDGCCMYQNSIYFC